MMDMQQTTTMTDFHDALAALEKYLETPVVPGEVESWLTNVRSACDQVDRLMDKKVSPAHKQLLRQIAEQDAELLPRVEHLREEEQALHDRSKELAQEVRSWFREDINELANQPDGQVRIERIRQHGLDFVIRARTQERALTTWHLEAFHRDRGPVD